MPQDDLIEADSPRVRCVAGPGTGKTWAMQRRVERLLDEEVEGEEIFAVTFTRHAAAQLRDDLTGLDIEGAEAIKVSTLHSHAFTILQREKAIEALGRHPRVCLEHELVPFHHDMSLDIGGVRESKERLKAFKAMWARLQNQDPGWPDKEEDQVYEEAYKNWMRFHQAITVGELVPLAVKYIRMNPANEAQGEFSHILVDEYQDLNRADQELVELLGEPSNLMVIGDDDQSIYVSLRYAHPEGIQQWIEEQPDPREDVRIRTCRRCGGNIISLADSLISENTGRIETELQPLPGREDEGEVDIVQWNTRNNETSGIATGVSELQSELADDEDVLVLVPRHEYARELGEEMEELGVDSFKVHSKPDWEDEDLGEGLSLLTLLDDPEDMVALRYWLGLGADDWRREAYRRIMDHCQENGVGIHQVLEDEQLMTDLGAMSIHSRWTTLEQRLDELRKMSDDELLNHLLPLEGSTEKVGRLVRNRLEQDDEGENEPDGGPPLSEVVRSVVIDPTEEEMDSNVNVMTYWGAKGLTAHTVVVTSLVNGILPDTPTPDPEEMDKLEEDRRLFYVSITRPKNHLILSSFRKVRHGEAKRLGVETAGGSKWWAHTQASRFLGELGPDTPEPQQGDDWLGDLPA